jgi:hypothetical protein
VKTIFLIILLSSIAQAKDSLEVVGGSLTYHLESSSDGRPMPYDHTLTPDHELIDNPLFGLGWVHQTKDDYYWGAKLFGGENSVGQPMTGLDASFGAVYGGWFIGVVGGGYVQNNKTFESAGVIPPSIAEFGDTGLVPIIGGEANYRINLWGNSYLKWNNLLTPMLYNMSLSIGFDL